ncbi:lysozyme [Advenella mimigardefordensis]|uniref:Lysozyme n=1 Tax=Advenella mimigardefordensis (strain DSM 17166 / LMG 22922 / DPN7) TaxID=1247726 RepID=W0P8P2_ADVMD|nr:lysozyme [Advenella mimigardefordensis]AHG63199.1 putative lysozyme [Advenella mimigardefordensis DPN7]
MNEEMKISQAGIDFIKSYEALRLQAYDDGVGVWTIGWGHTKGVKKGDKITVAQAEQYLRDDLVRFEKAVNEWVTVPLQQSQYDALVSFAFNVGTGNPDPKYGKTGFYWSTLRRLLNEGDYIGAANEFLRWDKAGGKVLAGLTRRRKDEYNMFLFREGFSHE